MGVWPAPSERDPPTHPSKNRQKSTDPPPRTPLLPPNPPGWEHPSSHSALFPAGILIGSHRHLNPMGCCPAFRFRLPPAQAEQDQPGRRSLWAEEPELSHSADTGSGREGASHRQGRGGQILDRGTQSTSRGSKSGKDHEQHFPGAHGAQRWRRGCGSPWGTSVGCAHWQIWSRAQSPQGRRVSARWVSRCQSPMHSLPVWSHAGWDLGLARVPPRAGVQSRGLSLVPQSK